MGAEKNLCGAWVSILRMRKSVAIRKMQLQLLRNNCKLMAILRGHMKYLQEWSFLERDHAHSLSGTTQALIATILRLPVSNGAMADIHGIRNAISSAVDVMHTIGNSTRTQLPKDATNITISDTMQHSTVKTHAAVFSLNGLPFSAVSLDKCLGVPTLQSFHSRTHSDGAVPRFAAHTSINAREIQQRTRAENTTEPNKASAFQ